MNLVDDKKASLESLDEERRFGTRTADLAHVTHISETGQIYAAPLSQMVIKRERGRNTRISRGFADDKIK